MLSYTLLHQLLSFRIAVNHVIVFSKSNQQICYPFRITSGYILMMNMSNHFRSDLDE